jgi:hypothetical protein
MKTIEEIAKDLCLCSEVGEKCPKCPNNDDGVNNRRCRDFRQYLAVKEAISLAQRWISVDEELPPVGEKVLVKLSTGNWSTSERCISTENGREHWKGSGTFADSITHWRPIELA